MSIRNLLGMSRRHFMKHMARASALCGSACAMGQTLQTHAQDMKKRHKSAILLWMGGGPATIDLWDLKPGAPTGGEFQPISTNGDLQISEHLPMMAKNMDKVSVVRSMSTREADHNRGRYYLHTGYVPSPNIEHPSYGSVISHQLMAQRSDLEIPPFVSVNGESVGPGFLGMAWAPFSVSSTGQVRNLAMGVDDMRVQERMKTLALIEGGFNTQRRGNGPAEHAKVLQKTLNLMTSEQMKAFDVSQEPPEMIERYGDNNFGRGCLMARRLVEMGVPFIEVGLGGWDNHQAIFTTLRDQRLPVLDQGMSALLEDLAQRDRLKDTAVIWMGEFGRTPRINGNGGRDHWARSWSVVAGGAGMNGGLAIGETNEDGTQVITDPYTSEDVMATVCKALGISLETTFTSRSGRPMKLANGGRVITELLT